MFAFMWTRQGNMTKTDNRNDKERQRTGNDKFFWSAFLLMSVPSYFYQAKTLVDIYAR